MIDLIATTKCGLLDAMFVGTFWLPLMPTVVVLTAFAVAHGLGRLLALLFQRRPIRLHRVWPTARVVLLAIAAILVIMMALRGPIYPLFLGRMVKDAYYCSYFEVSRDLKMAHLIVFGLMFAAHAFCIVLFDDRRFRRIDSASVKAVLIATYVVLGMAGYLMAIALNANLVPLTILFILPFAYFGIGILARHR